VAGLVGDLGTVSPVKLASSTPLRLAALDRLLVTFLGLTLGPLRTPAQPPSSSACWIASSCSSATLGRRPVGPRLRKP
jgi:hypothetical protein